jgi:hypothetical protein
MTAHHDRRHFLLISAGECCVDEMIGEIRAAVAESKTPAQEHWAINDILRKWEGDDE